MRAQLLAAPRPTDLLAAVHHLTFLQIDPTAAVAPSADLVAWSRLGARYAPADLRAALEVERTMFEYRAFVRPMSDLPLYLARMRDWPGDDWGKARDWLVANDRFRRFVLDLLRDSGALLSRDVPDRSDVSWPSTGWTNDRNVTQMLEFLAARGEIAISRREGRQRVWDLAERVYPPDAAAVPAAAATAEQDERRLRSLGVARSAMVGQAGEPAVVAGTAGEWRVDPAAIGAPFRGRTALLSPFDRLVHDRVRLRELFDYEYALEMYKPQAARRWGYFALPILHRDRLVGKLDAAVDRKAGVLRVDAVHEDVTFVPAVRSAVETEIDALATWLGVAPPASS